jgi:uncharacterized protein (TIGR02996 family)
MDAMTAVDHRAALFAAILADPADDTLRLAYADQLDELGTDADAARAAFIRVQVEFERLPAHVKDACRRVCVPPDFAGCPQHNLRRRERELLAEHGSDATGGLPCWRDTDGRLCGVGSAGWGHEFRRGFLAHVTVPSAAWIAHGDALLAAAPVTGVTLTDWPEARTAWGRTKARDRKARLVGRPWRRVASLPGKPVHFGHDSRALTPYLLRAEWPRVKTWHLPA